jgi:hypothetical protein
MKPYSRAALLKIVRELALPGVATQPKA